MASVKRENMVVRSVGASEGEKSLPDGEGFSGVWCWGAESNCRHRPFQGRALPAELPQRKKRSIGGEKRMSTIIFNDFVSSGPADDFHSSYASCPPRSGIVKTIPISLKRKLHFQAAGNSAKAHRNNRCALPLPVESSLYAITTEDSRSRRFPGPVRMARGHCPVCRRSLQSSRCTSG